MSAAPTPFYQVDMITFAFSKCPPLFCDFSLRIFAGECLGLTGPSGRGKSTLAQIMAGHLQPLSGEVFLSGRRVTGSPSRDVFLVHQESDLFPWLTVQKQIAQALCPLDLDRLSYLLKMTKLESYRDLFPHQLSSGMMKRLSIARALAVNPKLLIFDESFSALDQELRQEVFADLRTIWQTMKMTIVLISHDRQDIASMAQREIRI